MRELLLRLYNKRTHILLNYKYERISVQFW